MRGDDQTNEPMFSYVSAERRVPSDHPLRSIKRLVSKALEALSPRFDAIYSGEGRPSIPPEKLLRALLLQTLFSIRSERQLMEQLDYNLLFRWFVGLSIDNSVWDASTFSKNRERLMDGDIAEAFFGAVLKQAEQAGLLSKEHFTVDGTLIEAWASHKSFKMKGAKAGEGEVDTDKKNTTVDFSGTPRKNDTHESKTDPDCRLFRKSNNTAAQLCYMGHAVTENRNGLVVATKLTKATGKAEREAAISMLGKLRRQGRCRRGVATIGADKGYDTKDFARSARRLRMTPHVASKIVRSAVDGRTMRHEGYQVSQRKRKLVEECFGWAKTVGVLRKTRHRGEDRVGFAFTFTMTAYNLVRMRGLMSRAP